MMKIAAVVVALCGVFLTGCASQDKMAFNGPDLSRHGIVMPQQAREIEKSLTDNDIAAILSVEIKAKLPTNLAVARLGSYSGSGVETIDSAEVAAWEKALAGEKPIKSIRPITPLTLDVNSPVIHSLRSAAARMNCELLLVYVQADGSVDNCNDAAALYWTIIGLWCVPGNVYEHKTVMQAALIDCRTGMILGTAGGQCSIKTQYAAAYRDIAHDKLNSQTPAKALEDLQKNAAKVIAQTVAAAETRR